METHRGNAVSKRLLSLKTLKIEDIYARRDDRRDVVMNGSTGKHVEVVPTCHFTFSSSMIFLVEQVTH